MTGWASIPHSRRWRRGFTLIELMVSIALALLLVIGINAVFKMSADTVGTGMQVSEITRQIRTARTAMDNDFTHFAGRDDHPALILQMINQPAFKDHNDELAAETAASPYDPTTTDLDIAQGGALDVRDADGNSIPTQITTRTGINQTLFLPQILNNRNHRTDMMRFFIKDPSGIQRQTPNYGNNYSGGKMNSATSNYEGYYKSTEGWVVYGHVLQPDNSVNASNMLTVGSMKNFLGLGLTRDAYTSQVYGGPDAAVVAPSRQANPNNYYSTNWVLGRSVFLLGEPSILDNFVNPYIQTTPTPDPQTFARDRFVDASNGYISTAPPPQQLALRPLSWGTSLNVDSTMTPPASAPSGNLQIQSSQCDVAGASMLTMHDNALNAQNPTAVSAAAYPPRWYLPLVSVGTGASEPVASNPMLPPNAPAPAGTWIWPAPTVAPTQQIGLLPWHAYRMLAQAWPDKMGSSVTGGSEPMMNEQLSVQSPVFMRGCSQFIVEYAGDYLQQKNDPNDNAIVSAPNVALPPDAPVGSIKGIGEDGQIDFDVMSDPANSTPTNAAVIKRIRWYGMNRSLDDGQTVENPTTVIPAAAAPYAKPPTNVNMVRPLYRYVQQYTQSNSAPAEVKSILNLPFEKINNKNPSLPGGPTYMGFPDKAPLNVDSYSCAWGPLDMDLNQFTAVAPAPGLADPSLVAIWPYLQRPVTGAVGPVSKAAFPSRSLLPWMIRVTIRLDDPAGRLPDGQTIQFIFNVPRPH